MIPITVALVVVQEMESRMGAVTGKGLSDLMMGEYVNSRAFNIVAWTTVVVTIALTVAMTLTLR